MITVPYYPVPVPTMINELLLLKEENAQIIEVLKAVREDLNEVLMNPAHTSIMVSEVLTLALKDINAVLISKEEI
jgi:hypothetical protein